MLMVHTVLRLYPTQVIYPTRIYQTAFPRGCRRIQFNRQTGKNEYKSVTVLTNWRNICMEWLALNNQTHKTRCQKIAVLAFTVCFPGMNERPVKMLRWGSDLEIVCDGSVLVLYALRPIELPSDGGWQFCKYKIVLNQLAEQNGDHLKLF